MIMMITARMQNDITHSKVSEAYIKCQAGILYVLITLACMGGGYST